MSTTTSPPGPTAARVRFVGRIGHLYLLAALVLVPWVAYLAVVLPDRQVAANYDLAWVGFDIGLVVALLVTGVLIVRRSPWVVVTAASTAALLATDAWFDVVTSPHGAARLTALVLALVVELPLAALSLAVAVRVLRRIVAAQG